MRSALAALSLVHFTPACSSDDPDAPGTPTPTLPPGDFGSLVERWKRMREALAQSPDHLAARAEALVAAKDSRGLFTLFRDSIRTLPPFDDLESIETAVRYGTGSVLRSGAGTPRERAELLAALLVRAGFAARVVRGEPEGPLATSEARAQVYGRSIELAFAPGPPPAGGWGAESDKPIELLDPDEREAKALYDRIRPTIAGGDVRLPTLPSFSRMPFVALEEGGKTVYLNPLHADAAYGESYARDIAPVAPASAAKKVSVKISTTRVRAPGTPIELVSHVFGYDEIAGTRLRVSPQPTLPLAVLLQSKPSDVTSFVSSLSLFSAAGAHLSTFTGKSVTAFGDVVQTSGDASASGVPLLRGGDAKAVASVEVKASARAFPTIELEIAPKDAGGKIVAGLAAAAFAIEEDGVARSAVLRENGGAPRVLVLWDGTGSQPPPDLALGTSIGQAIFAAMPDARVQVSLLGGAPSASGFALADASAVGNALAGVSEVASPVWGGVLGATAVAPTLVLLFTDGDAEKTGDFEATRARALASVVTSPVIAIGCSTGAPIAMDVLDAIAAASGGKSVQAGDLTNLAPATAAIAEIAGRRSGYPYRLAYRASASGAATRNVKVTIGASATATYAAPSGAATALDSDAHGLHLTIDVGGRVVERTLAGLPVGVVPTTREQMAAASLSVHDFLLGTAWLTMEGGAPTLSAWIDDALSAAIDAAPAYEAAARGDTAKAYELAASVRARPFLSSLLAHAPIFSPSDVPVVELAPRVALHTILPMAAKAKLDILPTTRFGALLAPSGPRAFEATLQASLRLGVAESKVANGSRGSTATALGSAPLQALRAGTLALSDVPSAVPEAQRASFLAVLNQYSDFQRVVAQDGSSRAFWAVDPSTGSALGILPDASGGAVEECKQLVNTINTLMDQLIFLVQQIEGGVAPAVIVVAAIGKAAGIAVAEAALSFTDPIINPSIWKLGAILACEGGKQIISNVIPGGKNPAIVQNATILKGLAADALLGNDPICKAATPCTAPPP